VNCPIRHARRVLFDPGPSSDDVREALTRGGSASQLSDETVRCSRNAEERACSCRHKTIKKPATYLPLKITGERIGRPLTPDYVSPRVWRHAELGRSYTAVDVHRAVARLAAGVLRAPEWWAGGFDLLVSPAVQQPPPTWSQVAGGDEAAIWGLFTMPFSLTGQPALSLPLHWTADGLPVGVQLVADYGREDLLLRVAARLEEALPWRDRRPPIFAGGSPPP